ncbi:stress responsive A/B barrel domain-containing protein [Chytriomyces sp. MP71]|nr:stress responsive A/B barrel domain-containing protein [Chytriomyces sp. MP71]
MVLVHTVTLVALDSTTEDELRAASDALMALAASIAAVKSVRFGATFTTDRARGYTHQLVVELETKDDLAVYATHPAHVAVINDHLKGAFDLSKTLAMDFESLTNCD